MQTLTQEQVDKYLAGGGVSCPACGADNVTGDSVTIDAGTAHQSCWCEACGFEWCDCYALAAVEAGPDREYLSRSDAPAPPRALVEQLADYLEEAHEADVLDDHGGDDPATCSYCRAIAGARAYLEATPPEQPDTKKLLRRLWSFFGDLHYTELLPEDYYARTGNPDDRDAATEMLDLCAVALGIPMPLTQAARRGR